MGLALSPHSRCLHIGSRGIEVTGTSHDGDLKPCPFCGNEADISWDHYECYFVFCFVCGAEGPYADDIIRTEAEAIAAWNKRHADSIEASEAEVPQIITWLRAAGYNQIAAAIAEGEYKQ